MNAITRMVERTTLLLLGIIFIGPFLGGSLIPSGWRNLRFEALEEPFEIYTGVYEEIKLDSGYFKDCPIKELPIVLFGMLINF